MKKKFLEALRVAIILTPIFAAYAGMMYVYLSQGWNILWFILATISVMVVFLYKLGFQKAACFLGTLVILCGIFGYRALYVVPFV